MARDASAYFAYPPGFLARYFERLRYRFGTRERAGLAKFFALAHAGGVLDEAPGLRFALAPAAR